MDESSETAVAAAAETWAPAEDESLVEGEVLFEEISIDGMCGVY
jgi:mycofactocin precursor